MVTRLHPELKDSKSAFWKRRTSVLKVHMLLLAHLAREEVPAVLHRDLHFLLTKGLPMLQEMLGLATAPRIKPGYGWLAPTVGCIEMMQCMVQAVPLAAKKAAHVGKSAESAAALLQLPHFDDGVLRKLQKRRVKTLPGEQPQCASTLGTSCTVVVASCSRSPQLKVWAVGMHWWHLPPQSI
jgi:translocation protein SEC63